MILICSWREEVRVRGFCGGFTIRYDWFIVVVIYDVVRGWGFKCLFCFRGVLGCLVGYYFLGYVRYKLRRKLVFIYFARRFRKC